jgi:hypothetical protein
MVDKLCQCPERKCGSLATPYIIGYVEDNIGTSTLDELKAWCIRRFEWRRQQEHEYGNGVKPHNVTQMLADVKVCKTKASLLDLLENKADKYHHVVLASQSPIQELNDDAPPVSI